MDQCDTKIDLTKYMYVNGLCFMVQRFCSSICNSKRTETGKFRLDKNDIVLFSWVLWLIALEFSSSHAVRDLGRVRQYPPWLLFAAFVDYVVYPRYNPQKTRKQ